MEETLTRRRGKEKGKKEMATFHYLTLRYPNLAHAIVRTKAIPSFRLKHELDQVGVQSRVNLHLLTMNFIVSLTSLHFGLECFRDSKRQLGAVAALSVWDQVIHMPTHAQGRRKTSRCLLKLSSAFWLEKNCYRS